MIFCAPEPRRGAAKCSATISACPPVQQLEPEWRDLETRSNGSVFISWPWINSVLESLRPHASLARVTNGDRTVGLAVIGRRTAGAFSFRPSALHLNETGDNSCDGVMVEYNGLLTENGWEREAMDSLLTAIFCEKGGVPPDLHLSGVPSALREWCEARGLATRLLRPPQLAPSLRLPANSAEDPLDSLTRNSRQQIRRSMRYFEQRGALTLDRAADPSQALDWLDALDNLHTMTWRRRGKLGAFYNPSFKAFHRRLITSSFAEGVPDIIRARAGESVLGYLYNLRWKEIVYSYQSGFAYEQASQARPGLVTHMLAIQLYRREGMSAYRFLAGEARYKSSLANSREELLWMVISCPNLLQRLAAGIMQRSRLRNRG
jgi:CelD/BcsL family acetyltransferase involved in cellulose biosynthesis